MKKILLCLLAFFSISISVNATEENMVCFTDNTLCVKSDDVNAIKDNEDFGTLISRGNSYIKFNSSRFNDMDIQKSMTLELASSNRVNYTYLSNGALLTIVGDGTLKTKEICVYLGGAEVVFTPTHLNGIEEYVKGEYSYKVSGEYIVITGKTPVEKITASTPTLSASAQLDGTINLHVESSDENYGCVFYYATSKKGKYSKVKTLNDCSYAYEFTKSVPGKTYYFKARTFIKDVEGNIYSSYSPVVSEKALLDRGNAFVESTNKTTLTVKWSAISGASGYQVYRSTSLKGKYTLVKTTTATSFKNTGLTTGKRYYYKVRAYKTVGKTKGYGAFSDVINAVPMVGVPNASASSYNYSTNKITINKVSGANGYAIYRSESEDGTYKLLGTTTKTTYYDKKLETEKTYYYKVRAYATVSKSKKYGNYSEVISATPKLNKPVVELDNKTQTSAIKLSWNKVSGATEYNIYRYDGYDYSYLATSKTLEYVDNDVTLGEEYSYKVTAVRTIDLETVYSSELSEIVEITAKPQVPTLTISTDEANSLKIEFNSDETFAYRYYKFYLYRSTSKTGEFTEVYAGKESVVDSMLYFNKTYYYKAVLELDGAKSEESEVFAKKTALSKPVVSTSVDSKSSIEIEIEEVEGAEGYEIYRSTNKTKGFERIKTTSLLEYTNTKLTAGKTYYYKVRAYKVVSGKKVYGSFGDVVSGTPKVGAPTYVASVHSYNANKITITKVNGANGYAIYRSEDEESGYKLLKVTTSTTYYDKGLDTNKTYYYKVKAYSLVGSKKVYGQLGNIVSATPYMETPTITFDKVNTGDSITLNWNKINGAVGYEVYHITEDGATLLTDTTSLTYTHENLTMGENYTYNISSYILVNGEKVFSYESKYNTKQVLPNTPTIELRKMEENVFAVEVESKSYTASEKLFIVYRSVNGADYEKVMESGPGMGGLDTMAAMYADTEVVLGNTYSYKAVVKIDGYESLESEVVTRTATYDNTGEVDVMVNPDNTDQVTASIYFNDETEIDGIEVYQSLKSDSGYTLGATCENVYVGVDADWGKTYFYKIRFYRIVEGEKIYSDFSEPFEYKKELYPFSGDEYIFSKSGTEMKFNNFSYSQVKSTDETVTLKVTLNIANVTSTKARTAKIKVAIAPSQGDNTTKIYYLNYTVDIPKGTKKNVKVTKSITIPKNYGNIGFDSITFE